ncbi:MAG: flagellar biosynthetic protein FliR, partial [Myxococcota bacterium]
MLWAAIELRQWVVSAALIALVWARLAGFMVMSPFPGQWVPMRARGALVLSLGFAIGLGLPPADPDLELGLSLFPLALSDFALGAMVGAVFRIALSAADLMSGLV